MQLSQVIASIEPLSPLQLAEPWDRVGLHVGDHGQAVERALLCIDLTPAVLDEAIETLCGLLVAYHPPIFDPVKTLVEQVGWKQRLLRKLIQHEIAVYSPHTALDAAPGGMGDWLASGVGSGSMRPITPAQTKRDEYKVVVFVPQGDEAKVREAMSRSGAGWIGNYRECSFIAPGTGGFRALEGANPTIGQVGKRETVDELRLEMLVPGKHLPAVHAAIRTAHSYEEPAIDIFKLEPIPHMGIGAGRYITLDQPIDPLTLATRMKAHLGVAAVRLTGEQPGDASIRTVAVVPGAGGKLFEGIEADAYVTGEMHHHPILDLAQRGKAVVLAGHTNSERPYLPIYRGRLAQVCPGVDWAVSKADRNPWRAY
jgi:dinuclear metal center YbgI/SA1388 family protein